MVHGDKLSGGMHGACERILNPRIGRIKTSLEALKLSAAHAGSYSLSSNQIGIPNAFFIMHKELLDVASSTYRAKKWLHESAFAVQEAMPIPEYDKDNLSYSSDRLLDPADFSAFMNPRLLAETTHKIVDWEYCLSFPGVRCMVKRP